MAVRTQCPRCKQPLSVPNKLTGSYASCPRCQGRFWVSKDAPLDPSVSDSAGSLSASALTLTDAPIATPPSRPMPAAVSPASGPPPVSAVASPAAPPPPYFPSVTPPAPTAFVPTPTTVAPRPTVDGPPVAPPQARKVARLVSADTAQSTLKLAADGQLPQLQLQEVDKKDKGQGKSRSIPPLVMILAWIVSVVLTVAIVIITSDDGSSSATTEKKTEAMANIEKQFFGNPARLLPYQRLLREARQAHERKDFKGERQYYKQVLDLLHTELWGSSAAQASHNRLEKGVTGSRDRDRELEQLILTVLGE